MNDRRGFLKSLSAAGAAIPLLSRTTTAQSLAEQAEISLRLPDPQSADYWDKVRDQFLLARDNVFFNNGTIGAMPKVVVDRVVDHLHQMATSIAEWDYSDGNSNWISGYSALPQIRSKTARLLNAQVSEIGLTENVTSSASYVADGLDLGAGDEIITTNQEHEGGRSCWLLSAQRRKTILTELQMPVKLQSSDQVLDLVRKAITSKTKVIALSHVVTGTGAIMPVQEICAHARSHGIFTVLDGAQAFGHIPVDVKAIGCDAYIGCFHKWMLAPAGTGFLYIRKDAAPRVWTSVASGEWDNHEDNGYRFTQRGTGSMSNMMGLEAALDFHSAIGADRVTQRIKFLGDYLRDGLRKCSKVTIHTPDDPNMCGGITVYGIQGHTGKQIQDEMWARDRLRPRASGDRGVRHCTHIFNSTAEIDRALKIVNDLARA